MAKKTVTRKPIRARTPEELMAAMGVDPAKLKQQLPLQKISKEDLKKLIREAIEETPIPQESKKSIVLHLYDAMTVIGTGYGFWQFLEALMKFVSSFTMSANEPPPRLSEDEKALQEAQRIVSAIDPTIDAFTIAAILTKEIEIAIVEGAVESGKSPATAALIAASMSLPVQQRLFNPNGPIRLDEKTVAMLTHLWQLSEANSV